MAGRVGGERARPPQQHSGAPGRAAVAGSAHSLGGRQGRHGLALALPSQASWQLATSPVTDGVSLLYRALERAQLQFRMARATKKILAKSPRRRASGER